MDGEWERLGHVERRLTELDVRQARTEQRLSDVDTRLVAMVEVTTTVVRLVERVETLRGEMEGYVKSLAKITEDMEKREGDREEQTRESKRERRQIVIAFATLTVMILCALIGAAVVIATH